MESLENDLKDLMVRVQYVEENVKLADDNVLNSNGSFKGKHVKKVSEAHSIFG